LQGKVSKVIGFEEHYKLPAIQEANRDNPGELVYDVWKKAGRFETIATLPMLNPEAAASELVRVVRDQGFVGALINGHVNGRYLDDKFFWPVFECAEALDVPIYLHPVLPPKPVVDAYYSGFDPYVSSNLSAAGLGWHIDTGIHCVRLILGGVFDRFPGLQIIVGHQFEALSWMAWRTDYSFQSHASGGLKRTINAPSRNTFVKTSTAASSPATSRTKSPGPWTAAGVCPSTPISAW
jgi:uncharacterized protein